MAKDMEATIHGLGFVGNEQTPITCGPCSVLGMLRLRVQDSRRNQNVTLWAWEGHGVLSVERWNGLRGCFL